MKKTWKFVTSMLGMSVSAAVLILFIPPFFSPGEQGNVWAVGVLGCLAVVLAAATLYWRPSTSDLRGD